MLNREDIQRVMVLDLWSDLSLRDIKRQVEVGWERGSHREELIRGMRI
jgi:hypothetical protein